MIEERQHKHLEYNLNLENSLKEKDRIENNYNQLLNDHQKLEINLKEIQQQYMQLGHEIREINMKLTHSELLNENMQKTIDDFKEMITEKEKMINELNKKLKISNNLNIIRNMPRVEKVLSPRLSFSKMLLDKNDQQLVTSITPRANSRFIFDKKLKNRETTGPISKTFSNNDIKEQIIKNLKAQLDESNRQVEKLEEERLKLVKQNEDFIEKIKLLNIQSYQYPDYGENEEEYRFDTVESLRDEIAVLNVNFPESSRNSIKPKPNLKEIATQVDISVARMKSRYSCFAFFG